MHTKKVVILYASCGAGHYTAAQAIAERFAAQSMAVEIKDILDFAPSWYKRIYRDGYYFLIRKMPWLWGFLYRSSERKGRVTILDQWVRLWETNLFRDFYRFLDEAKPNLVIATHFLPGSLLAGTNRGFKFMVVVTDYYAHSLWLSERTDQYFVASEEVKGNLVDRGVNSEIIAVTGIPIKPVPGRKSPMADNNVLGIDPAVFKVLLLSGAGGSGRLAAIIKSLEKYAGSLQLIVSTGIDQKLLQDLRSKFATSKLHLKLIDFNTPVYPYFQAVDLVITKPGGLTITECMAFGLPLLMVNVIPGQEEGNAEYMREKRAGILVKDLRRLPVIVGELMKDRLELAEMGARAMQAAPKNSAQAMFKIAQAVLKN